MSDNFNIDRAIVVANWCKAAYWIEPFLSTPDCHVQMLDLRPKTDVQCLVVREPTRLTFAFRGTVDMQGWLNDSKIAFHTYGQARPGVKMHTGFHGTVAAIWDTLWPIAAAAHEAGLPIYGTGHSKGAGEILDFVYRLAVEKRITAKEVITFGGPRVFNRAGSRDYETLLIPTWRILDEDDMVARIPWRFGLYKHVGQSAFFDGWGNMEENSPWYSHLASDIYVLIKEAKIRQDALTYDHGIDKYIPRMVAWKAQMGL